MIPKHILLVTILGALIQGKDEVCPLGTYGETCGKQCSTRCAHSADGFVFCHKLTGRCSEGCHRGWHGDKCNLLCSKNCLYNVCNVETGTCIRCKANYSGDYCETYTEPGPKQSERGSQNAASPPLVPILVSVLVISLFIVIIVAVTGLCMRRRKYQRRRPTDVECEEMLSPGTADTDLHVACMHGKLKRVREILDKSLEDINKPGTGGMTPVMWAARRGHRELVDLLVKKGADVTLVDGIGNSILHWARFGGHVAMLKHVVTRNMGDINCRRRDGRTPLMCAARQGNKEMFHLLVSKEGIPSEVDSDGNNILHLACLGGNVKVVNYILSHDDVDINGKGQSGRTPLMAAACKGHGKIFDLLVTKGADLRVVDDAGDNVVHSACLGTHVDIVSCVLDLDEVDINIRGHCGRTPLMIAARNGEKDMFDLLVDKGADATLLDDDSSTILHLAAEGGNLDIVKYAVEVKNVDINGRNKRNETAAKLATNGSDVCNLLVQRGGLIQ